MDNIDNTLLELKVKTDIRTRNRNKELAAISKLTERYIMQKIQLQLQNDRPITSTNPDVSEEEYLIAQFHQLQEEQQYESERLEKVVEEKGYKDKPLYTFITINPANTQIPIDEFKPIIDNIIDKTKWINQSEYAYVFEQRGDTLADTHGLHCHMLVKTDDKPRHEIIREIFNKLGKIVNVEKIKKDFKRFGYKQGPVTFDPTINPANRIKYMLAWKKDKKKHIKQVVDTEYREKYGLEQIYYQGELFSSLILEHIECQEDIANVQEDPTQEKELQEQDAI